MDLEFIKNVGLLIGISDFLLYVAFIWGRYGIQRSISISFYDLPMKNKFVFRLFIWILSSAIIISGIGWGSPMFLISGLLLSLVGIFTHIKVKWKFKIHMIGAIGGILSCAIGILMLNLNVGLIASGSILLGSLLLLLLGNKKHIIWNIEVICFASLMSALLYLNNM